MKAAVVAMFVLGCGGGGAGDDDDVPGDGPPSSGGTVERRTVFSRSAMTPATQFTFDGDAAIAPGDQLIALIEANTVDDIELSSNAGWTVLAEDLAVQCINPFHVWVLTQTASANTTFDFTFTAADSFTAIVTAYTHASASALMDFKLMGTLRNMPINYAPATLTPGSMIWIGGGGQTNWTSLDAPVGTTQITATDFAAAFELPVPDGNAPMIELPNDNGFCANVAQVGVAPD